MSANWDVNVSDAVAGASESEARSSLDNAIVTWRSTGCLVSDLRVVGVSAGPPASGDARNTVAFISSGWTALGHRPDEGAATELILERDADGRVRIVEADILLNAEHFTFATENAEARGALDLQSVLTHELGHALGLLQRTRRAGPVSVVGKRSGK